MGRTGYIGRAWFASKDSLGQWQVRELVPDPLSNTKGAFLGLVVLPHTIHRDSVRRRM